MKKSAICVAALLFSTQPLLGEMDTIHVDGRVSAFYPQSSLFREIYGNWQVDYELEIGKIFLKNYEAWIHTDWVSTSGHSTLGDKTSFHDLNVSLGGKYIFNVSKIAKVYLGLGINGAFVHVHNDSDFVERNVNKQWVGGVAKSGIYIEPVEHFFIDIFADYLYQQIHFSKWQQIGGLKLGGGIGFCF